MKKSISTLDYIVNISARKLQYFEYIKNKSPEFKKHQEAIKDTIANMDNLVFLTPNEIKINEFQEKIELDGYKIEANFKDTFEKRHSELDSSVLFL
jgi:hypothetical protein